VITLVFNANSSQNIAKGKKDSAAYCCIAWLGSLAFKRANAYKSICIDNENEAKQDKTLIYLPLFSTKLLRPFSLYLQPSKLKFLLDRHLATYSLWFRETFLQIKSPASTF